MTKFEFQAIEWLADFRLAGIKIQQQELAKLLADREIEISKAEKEACAIRVAIFHRDFIREFSEGAIKACMGEE